MNIQHILEFRCARARRVYQEDGIVKFLITCIMSLIKPIYMRHYYYLFKNQLNLTEIKSNLSKHKPKINIDDLTFQVVTSNAEADKLEEEGFEFRSYPYIFSPYTNYTKMLDDGLIAFCTFVGKEFASISWIIPSQQAHDRFKTLPLKIDYSNHDAFPRAAWCNPKYRDLGIYRYTVNNRNLYLRQMGFKTLRAADDYKSKISVHLSRAMGDIQYGKAVYTNILGWKFWKETHE